MGVAEVPWMKVLKAIKNNMSTQTQAVETKAEAAAPQPETVATPTATEVDYEALLAEKDAELARVRDEKENYRKGMLKAKGKLPQDEGSDDNDASPENLEAIVERKVQEKLLNTREAQIQAERDQALKAVLKRNKELELALKNRAQVASSSGQGSNLDKPEVKSDSFFSNDQIASLKAKGWSDEKIAKLKENLVKTRSGSQLPPIIN